VVLMEPVARVGVRRGDLHVVSFDGRQPAWRSQESSAAGETFGRHEMSMRPHNDSSIAKPLLEQNRESYTQSYPKVWITGGVSLTAVCYEPKRAKPASVR